MWHSFSVRNPGLSRVLFFVSRTSLDATGDLEYGFFSATTAPVRHTGSLAGILLDPAVAESFPVIVTVRNPSIVFDGEFLDRLKAALDSLEALGDGWSVATPHGLSRNGEVVSSVYSAVSPALPTMRSAQPVVDVAADLLVINGAFIDALRAGHVTFADACLEQALLIRGYLDGRVGVFLPGLAVPMTGPFLAWAGPSASDGLDAAFGKALGDDALPGLFGPVRFGKASPASPPGANQAYFADLVAGAIRHHCPPLSLSLVTRTRFNRPHLLNRMLTSVTRSRVDGTAVEVVLSTDIATREAQEQFRALKKLFPSIDLRLQINERHEHSRIGNLLGGIAAATRDFVAFVDDDDYVDLAAFGEIALATFMGTQPLVLMANVVHEEEWSSTPSGRYVLARSTTKHTYPPGGWRSMFNGVNQLPISAMIMPRATLQRRLEAFEFRHDLSEDYILILLLLTDPALPPIAEVPSTFVHISSRVGQDNTITMTDRRPWVQDITCFLADLLGDSAVAGPGVWQFLRGLTEQSRTPREDLVQRNLQEVVLRQRRDIGLLTREIRRLTDLLGAQE